MERNKMKKAIFLLGIIIMMVSIACDAPSPFSWQGKYQKNTDIYTITNGQVGILEVEADPDDVTSLDDRVVITATVSDTLGRVMQDVDVTFTTDTGFFRSDDFGPSEIFTIQSDSEGKAYAHLLRIGRTCTVKIEAGDLFVHVVITASITP